MTVGTRPFGGFVFVATGVVLGIVLLSQYWGGLAPCELCLMERWPWDASLVVALAAAVIGGREWLRWVALVLALLFAASAALAFYHVGVEQHWFAGPSACTASNTSAASIEELRKQILGHQAVACDQPQWTLAGVSLAGWNLLASVAMAAICLFAARKAR